MQLSDVEFVDLYLGSTFADFKGLKGSKNLRDPVPEALYPQLVDVRKQCKILHVADDDPEFAMAINGIMFRVTAERELSGKGFIYVLRRSTAQLRTVERLGISPALVRIMLDPALKGLILIAGETGAGKTSTACAVLKARLERIGGIAVAIEDPPELDMNGVHGLGRCVQVRASRRTGGYKEHLTRALRMNPDMIFLGEVREEAAAEEVVQASINGHFIISTIHASGPIEAIDRLATLAGSRNLESAYKSLAQGLKMVIWQSLSRDPDTGRVLFSYQALPLVEGVKGYTPSGPRSKIMARKTSGLVQEIDQVSRLLHISTGE